MRTSGGTGSFAALGGGGPIGKLYFYQGRLVAQGSGSSFSPAYINATPSSECTTFGPLGFGSGSNKCALSQGFELQSDTENSQLGAKLVFKNQGGFVACGATQDVGEREIGYGSFTHSALLDLVHNQSQSGTYWMHPCRLVHCASRGLRRWYTRSLQNVYPRDESILDDKIGNTFRTIIGL